MSEKAMTEASELIARQTAEIDRLRGEQRARPGLSIPGVEAKKFSIARAVLALKKGGLHRREAWDDAGYEHDVFRESQKAMSRSTDSAGGFLIPEEALGVIDMLHSKLVIAQAGITEMPNLRGSPVVFPREISGPTADNYSENGTGSPSDLVLGEISLTPHRVEASTKLSNQLLIDNQVAADTWIKNHLIKKVVRRVELNVISGSGASNQPTGIINTSGIGSVAAAGATGAEKLTALTSAFETIENADGDLSNGAWLMHPSDYWAIVNKQISAAAGTTPAGLMLGGGVAATPRMLLGLPIYASTNIAANTALLGDFSQALLGSWGGLELKVTGEGQTLTLDDMTLIVARRYIDVGVFTTGSFCKVTGL